MHTNKMIFFLFFFTLFNLSIGCGEKSFKIFNDHYEKLQDTYLENIQNYLNPLPIKNEKQAHPVEIQQKTNPFALIARDIQYHKQARRSQYYRQIATWLIPVIVLLKDTNIDLQHKIFFYATIPQDLKDKVFKKRNLKNPSLFYNQIAYALKMNIIDNLRLILDNNPELKNSDTGSEVADLQPNKEDLLNININKTIFLCTQFDCVSEKIPIPEKNLIPQKDTDFEEKLAYEHKLSKKNTSQLMKIYVSRKKIAYKPQVIRHLKNRLRVIAWKIIMLPLQPFIFFNTQLNKITDWLFDIFLLYTKEEEDF